MSKFYRIGLDIGIGSVGYAVIENDPVTEEPCRIMKLGVRTFSPNEVDKTGESTAKNRRENRGIRRRKRRKAFRFERTRNLISKTFGKQIFDELNLLCLGDKEKGISPADVYRLRAKALDEKLSDAELCRVILHLLKRRGFKSNRKSQSSNKDDGLLLKATGENRKRMEDNGYRTIGEMLYLDPKFKREVAGKTFYDIRNHGGDYSNCFFREDLSNELDLILKTQRELGNEKVTEEFESKILEIFNSQRNFDEGPGKESPYKANFEVGNCTFIPTEKRAPKASYTFELFNALSKINNLKVNDTVLSDEQRNAIYNKIKEQKELKFEDIRKMFKFSGSEIFNLCSYKLKKEDNDLPQDEYIQKCENKVFISMKNSYEIKKKLKLESSYESRDIIDEVANILSYSKSDSKIDNAIANSEILKNLTDEQKQAIKEMNFDKFGSLSYKAMKMIEPFLLQGQRYDVACQSTGFNHSSFEHEKMKYLKGKEIDERLADITNNVVKRSVNQTLRIVNQIIKTYGSPEFISIELARELGKNHQDRDKINKQIKERTEANDDFANKLTEKFHIVKPTGQDILKYKLYEEQCGKCMYSGHPIDETRLFEPNYVQIDHILPISKSLNDSYNNKVLVIADQNQNKGDKTPYEFFGSDEERWNNFVARVMLLKNREKQRNLLKKTITEDDSKEFISRNLNDTRYMSKLLLGIFEDYLQMAPVKQNGKAKRKVVYSVNGAITSYLRKCWRLAKIRDDGDIHHAVDASLIAMVDDSITQKITRFNKFKETFAFSDGKFINKTTGEVMTKDEMLEYKTEQVQEFGKTLAEPYPNFVNELKIRSTVKYDSFEFSNEEKQELLKLGYSDEEMESAKPVFVSRMKTVKKTGAIHQETMMSTREYEETGNLIKTVPISSLKLKSKIESVKLKDDKYPEFSIENYYRPEDDRLLYLKLKEILHDNPDGLKKGNVHKPRKDGSDGPLVRSVKQYYKASKPVITKNGGALNGSMFRVDVFEKDKKFYLCPVYMSDVYAHKLPNKVIEIGKDWTTIDKSFNFKFSLYQNDLVKITSKKDIVLKKTFDNPKSKKPDSINGKEMLVYYNSTGIAVASIKIQSHDNCYKQESLGVKTLLNMEKYYVDIMGNVYKAPENEKREKI